MLRRRLTTSVELFRSTDIDLAAASPGALLDNYTVLAY
jgi:hypothetical protein